MSPLPILLEHLTARDLEELGVGIALSLDQDQGFRLGESTVVSRYVHTTSRRRPGEIRILVNRDAGMEYLKYRNPGQTIHVDVFHEPACVQNEPLVRALAETIQTYSNSCRDESFLQRFYLETGSGSGSLWTLSADPETPEAAGDRKPAKGKKRNHVHILLSGFTKQEYTLIPCLVDAVETVLGAQQVEIRRVEHILHSEKKGPQPGPGYPCGLDPDQNKHWQLAASLTAILSSPEDAIEFLQAFQPGLFRRRQFLSSLRRKHGNLRELVIAMADAGLLKRGVLMDTLTGEGQELLEFVMVHQRELESQLRKILRAIPAPHSGFRSIRHSQARSRQKHYSYMSKTTIPMQDSWLGSIAVAETLVQAAKNTCIQQRGALAVQREDIRIHAQEISKPIDTCLIIDGSASMAGPKMKAVWQLAEHLLLATRDKVGVVVFQERQARVAVPFTRNCTRLKNGLRTIQPKGMTPLADGIMEAIDLIKNRHVRNPLLVLITDGVPTFGKWSINPREDALKAAEHLSESRAKTICIGVASNQEFLKELTAQAGANLYIVENLEERTTLIEIVQKERRF